MEEPSYSQNTEEILGAGSQSTTSSSDSEIEGASDLSSNSSFGSEVTMDEFITNLDPNRKTFYVKKGLPYYGVYFTLDRLIPFTANDCINGKVTRGHEVDLDKLEKILKKCHGIENLKFFGVRINGTLINLIANKCPKLKNLELNPHEKRHGDDYYNSDSDYGDELKQLIENCKDLENIIIRNPPVCSALKNFGYDKVDRNFFLCSEKSDYDTFEFAHHNVNTSKH